MLVNSCNLECLQLRELSEKVKVNNESSLQKFYDINIGLVHSMAAHL